MEKQINEFLIKWDEMVKAANAIGEFKVKLSIGVESNNQYAALRNELISGVNKSFIKNGMKYQSSSSN